VPSPQPPTVRISLIGVLRNALMGMAITEIVFLVGWSSLSLCGDRLWPTLQHLPLTALRSLGEGMIVAGAFGLLAGVISALAFNIGWPPLGPSPEDERLRAAGRWPARTRPR
jgi:uncharacterized membrane protein